MWNKACPLMASQRLGVLGSECRLPSEHRGARAGLMSPTGAGPVMGLFDGPLMNAGLRSGDAEVTR